MTSLAFDHPALNAHAAAPASPLSQALMTLAVTVSVWEMRAKTRQALRDMDPNRYPDIGLTTAEVLHEVGKPFWVA
ncbi:hypothetical protein JANAI62_22210 [Jannaschia pagri]|uniref:DUF1127 domain-containing protein n=1 Tax=Jannaschia pagri TaxID=2829797 RepID=A0ABQ4NMI7_9RHOB|nr:MULTISPECIES: hypothetical protein [unclassified Jannaschia]GIT91764.1 hypothetical protein JANAI61_22220 [Jannaschia sp. AI_61]GIT95598.1 hypothetical protein JANAI62_22210 [Jannaschia sp. AI_62]